MNLFSDLDNLKTPLEFCHMGGLLEGWGLGCHITPPPADMPWPPCICNMSGLLEGGGLGCHVTPPPADVPWPPCICFSRCRHSTCLRRRSSWCWLVGVLQAWPPDSWPIPPCWEKDKCFGAQQTGCSCISRVLESRGAMASGFTIRVRSLKCQ